MNSILAGVLGKLASVFLDKKKIISWLSAVVFVALAAAAGMSTPEMKEAVCGAPVVAEPAAPAPAK